MHITIRAADPDQYADPLTARQLPRREHKMNPTDPVVRPTPVALYACIHDEADPVTVMRALRETATTHGWKVTASLYDTGAP
ncbi:hypothetical protein GCM10023080_008100 [Streptomyces pseudoechinosporeus]